MDVLDAVGVEVDDLVGGVGDAGLLHGGGGGTELVHQALEPLGHKGTGELDGAGHLLGVGDGHDAGDHGDGDARLPDLVEEVIEQVVVEEHLGGEEGTACIHLLLQVADILRLVGAFRVDLGVAGAADAEVRAAFLQLPDQVHGVVVDPAAAVAVLELRRQVAPQGHDVFDAGGLHVLNAGLHRLPGGGDAGQVGQGGDAVSFLDVFGDIQGVAAGAAAGAVGDAHKGGTELGDLLCGGFDALKGGVRLGREDLEGEGELVSGE